MKSGFFYAVLHITNKKVYFLLKPCFPDSISLTKSVMFQTVFFLIAYFPDRASFIKTALLVSESRM